MSEYGTFKIGKCEHTMFSNGDIFCSLTPEELEVERQEARELEEKFHELMLLEESSKMTVEDFFVRWMKYLERDEKDEREYDFEISRRKERESWFDYKYRMDTYDRERATEKKLNRWRTVHMVLDHVWIAAMIGIAYLAWIDWRFLSNIMIILIGFNIITIGYKWSTFLSSKEWEVS